MHRCVTEVMHTTALLLASFSTEWKVLFFLFMSWLHCEAHNVGKTACKNQAYTDFLKVCFTPKHKFIAGKIFLGAIYTPSDIKISISSDLNRCTLGLCKLNKLTLVPLKSASLLSTNALLEGVFFCYNISHFTSIYISSVA